MAAPSLKERIIDTIDLLMDSRGGEVYSGDSDTEEVEPDRPPGNQIGIWFMFFK